MDNFIKNDSMVEDVEIFETMCIWYDLLGYGKSFYESDWNLTTTISYKNIKRIKFLEKMIKTVPIPLVEKVLLLNDGIIRNVDVCKKGSYVEMYIMWLENAIKQFYNINFIDKNNGNAGMRGVLTFGQRAQYTSEIIKMADVVKTKNNTTNEKIIVYSPNEFQMNTAFSKAYIMESGGSKAGITGPNLYVDEFFIKMFINILNESELQELIRLNDGCIEKHMVKFSGEFIKEKNQVKLNIKVNIEGFDFDFMIIKFASDFVKYNNEKCNIKTNLYKISGLWTWENGDII